MFSPFLAVLLLLLAAGCEDGLGIVGSGFFGSNLTIQATFENVDEPASKTTLHSDGHVYWTPSDAISLFYGSGENGGSRFVSDLTADDRVSSFSGNISAVTGVSESSADQLMFWGLYPYDPESSCDGQTVTTTIRSVQEGMADTFAPGFAPSLGRAPGLLLSFRNIFSGLYFTVTEPGYLSMTLRSNNGEPISGRAKIGFDSNGYPEVRDILEGSSSVSVTAPTSEGFEVGKKYYVLFYPQTFTGGFTLELRSTSQKAHSQWDRTFLSSATRSATWSGSTRDRRWRFHEYGPDRRVASGRFGNHWPDGVLPQPLSDHGGELCRESSFFRRRTVQRVRSSFCHLRTRSIGRVIQGSSRMECLCRQDCCNQGRQH